jgi:hypothetical protein
MLPFAVMNSSSNAALLPLPPEPQPLPLLPLSLPPPLLPLLSGCSSLSVR